MKGFFSKTKRNKEKPMSKTSKVVIGVDALLCAVFLSRLAIYLIWKVDIFGF